MKTMKCSFCNYKGDFSYKELGVNGSSIRFPFVCSKCYHPWTGEKVFKNKEYYFGVVGFAYCDNYLFRFKKSIEPYAYVLRLGHFLVRFYYGKRKIKGG